MKVSFAHDESGFESTAFVAREDPDAKLETKVIFATSDPGPMFKPDSRLAFAFKAVVEAVVHGVDPGPDVSEEASVYLHEGTDYLPLDQLRNQLAMLPEFDESPPEVDMSTADVGEPDENTPGEIAKLRSILEKHRPAFMSSGNALPPAARGVVCDIEVPEGTKPVAQRPRPIKAHLLPKVYELLKGLLRCGFIEYSDSDWASPIVIVMKKNGQDIRLCIDYRLVNQLIKLMRYPLPLIDQLLDNFESVMWFLSLDMASGFWAVLMTLRAKHISAFICPLGHFQWVRMPFGLKNSPLIYQQIIDNCLWGIVRLPPELEQEVDSDVLEGVGLKAEADLKIRDVEAGSSDQFVPGIAGAVPEGAGIPVTDGGPTVFQRNLPAPAYMGSVLGKSSYIDDVAAGTQSWDELCDLIDRLLYRVRYWGLSVSLPKSSFGKRAIEFLSHEVSRSGLRALPKVAKGIEQLQFPANLKGIQSFLGSLNYYHKFIEDYSVIASVLYELTDEQIRAGRDLDRAKSAFELLKLKIQSPLVLRHPDRQKPFSIILHANDWAVSAVLSQEHDGKLWPVRFTGRTLHDAELRYHESEKEVLALLRVLTTFHTLVAGSELVVYTRYSVLKWLMTSKSLGDRLLKWATFLSPWMFEVRKVERDQDGLASLFTAGMTPREKLDEIAENLAPVKASESKPPVISLEMLDAEYSGLVLSFDGAAKLKSAESSAGFVVWELPGWKPVHAEGIRLSGASVNEAEYQGMLHGLRYVRDVLGVRDVVVAGDSRIAIQQCQGIIGCNTTHLQLLLNQYMAIRDTFTSIRLVHVKREFNAAADYLTGKVLRLGSSVVITDPGELDQLAQLNELPTRIVKPAGSTADPVSLVTEVRRRHADPVPESTKPVSSKPVPKEVPASASVYAVQTRRRTRPGFADVAASNAPAPTRSGRRMLAEPTVEGFGPASEERWTRIRAHQRADPEFEPVFKFLSGDLQSMTSSEVRAAAKIADIFEIDDRGVLRYAGCKPGTRARGDMLPLVVPPGMRADVLHLHHDDLQDGHQGITRTYERIRSEYYWRGLFKDVERHVKGCVDCVTAKGSAPNSGPSHGNVKPDYPMQIVSMDFVMPLPESRHKNTALLLFQDMFKGYVMSKAMRGTSAQEVAEAYEEVVFRRFGASSILRHDRDPRFMSEVFRHFSRMMGSQQRATLAYRPQANGQQERSVQTVIRAIRSYVEEPGQEDWEDLAGRLTFALNTSRDATRRETPFFLLHGWDAKTTMAAMLAPRPSDNSDKMKAYTWRVTTQRQYQYAQAEARELQRQAQRTRSDERQSAWEDLPDKFKAGFEVGDSVWLYIAKVKEGLSRKLAHHWHGPFRIVEKGRRDGPGPGNAGDAEDSVAEDYQDIMCRLEIRGSPYRVFPWVHVSRLKPRLLFEERPSLDPVPVPEEVDFDAALLPEDSWEPEQSTGEYEVEAFLDVKWGRTRTGRRTKEYLVKWAGYEQPSWEPVHRLSCGRLLFEFDRSARGRARFAAMQTHDGSGDG